MPGRSDEKRDQLGQQAAISAYAGAKGWKEVHRDSAGAFNSPRDARELATRAQSEGLFDLNVQLRPRKPDRDKQLEAELMHRFHIPNARVAKTSKAPQGTEDHFGYLYNQLALLALSPLFEHVRQNDRVAVGAGRGPGLLAREAARSGRHFEKNVSFRAISGALADRRGFGGYDLDSNSNVLEMITATPEYQLNDLSPQQQYRPRPTMPVRLVEFSLINKDSLPLPDWINPSWTPPEEPAHFADVAIFSTGLLNGHHHLLQRGHPHYAYIESEIKWLFALSKKYDGYVAAYVANNFWPIARERFDQSDLRSLDETCTSLNAKLVSASIANLQEATVKILITAGENKAQALRSMFAGETALPGATHEPLEIQWLITDAATATALCATT